jgi:hypothetical protein
MIPLASLRDLKYVNARRSMQLKAVVPGNTYSLDAGGLRARPETRA